jgi:geranylgeranyl diphosphate synthase type II
MASEETSRFLKQVAQLRETIDAAMEQYIDFDRGCPDQLRKAVRHSLLAPGKRMRPILVLLAAEACGCAAEKAMPAACAVEMVHTYSLIHDDLPAMDDDDVRRGLPSCHAAYGVATAILAGDALLALAFQVLAERIRPAEIACRCCAELAAAAGATALVGGQADDLLAERTEGTLAQLESIHNRKTGAMICGSLRIGGLIGGANSEQLIALDTYGKRVGLAFQVVDDLLDAQGDEQVLGKPAGKDKQRGKLTFPGLIGVEESTRRAGLLIEEACRALTPFGDRTGSLEALARYVLERNR